MSESVRRDAEERSLGGTESATGDPERFLLEVEASGAVSINTTDDIDGYFSRELWRINNGGGGSSAISHFTQKLS